MTAIYRNRVKHLETWQAREETKVWQKAVFEKAHRLVRLHEAIEAVEALPSSPVVIRVLGAAVDEHGIGYRDVPVERGNLLALLRGEEQTIMQDTARILRQVTE